MSAVSGTERPLRPGWALALVSVCAFLTSLDVMVVVTAIPTIKVDLGAGLADLEWTINAYNLAFACLMLTGAALGDRFGRRRMYVIGLAAFTIASIMAASAGSIDILIIARVIQGVAAGVSIPVSLALLADATPPEKRGAAMGIWGSVAGIAIAAGPVIGGIITQGISWHWIFWLNVPFGIAATVGSALLLRESKGPRPKIDVPGLLLASTGLFGLVWAAVRAPSIGWGSFEAYGSVVGGVVLLALFVAWEFKAKYPMLPMEYFRHRGFTVANISAFLQHFALIGALFVLAQLFQFGLGSNAMVSGLQLLAWTAMPLVVAPFAGKLADKHGSKPFMVAGLALLGIGLLWIGLVTSAGVGYGSLVVPLIFGGAGIAMCLPTTINLVFASVPPEDAGVASGVNSALRELGGVFGVVALGAAFAANGSFESAEASLSGFQAALVLGGIVALVGTAVALFAPGKPKPAGPVVDVRPPAEEVIETPIN
ncbi:major facilitator transporter [Amycolatopsis mediterranei S699]|uniref:Major facilitator transporter n=2 Tax=Amycolatopsis mediterranei TaxID=33910 RepID=A0A0H3DEB2_AMYMU|nr:MFS transporter [Amycolatopsis mediterranei]ADJ48572.1 major facilitator transporter [Amycolatopsis mediterranei U32]AFO80281.1 major facilitator transporter [Amycolatopsis mediterranei S699]AGT87409.1 major facilitator transporter [Amycolatopsis mediterranei RB]KDO11181.1 major facilitator transporter [Amycolatopsis mediterranei]KDU85946.1 major facilitator transporter [Amycolatopsis mediterranei]